MNTYYEFVFSTYYLNEIQLSYIIKRWSNFLELWPSKSVEIILSPFSFLLLFSIHSASAFDVVQIHDYSRYIFVWDNLDGSWLRHISKSSARSAQGTFRALHFSVFWPGASLMIIIRGKSSFKSSKQKSAWIFKGLQT